MVMRKIIETDICKFRAHYNGTWYEFCLGSPPKDFTKNELNKISLNRAVYDFSVDHSSIEKEDIFSIHKHLIKK